MEIPHHPTTQMPDSTLIALSLNGCDDAFDILYRRYRLQLYAYLYKQLPGNVEQVKELAQHTWVKACHNLNKYNDRQKFLAWLCRIAHNLTVDYFRECGKFTELTDDGFSSLPSPTEQLISEEFSVALEQAIAALPEEQRQIVLMRTAGNSFKDIVNKLGINQNTALSRMHYAIQTLKKSLADFLQ